MKARIFRILAGSLSCFIFLGQLPYIYMLINDRFIFREAMLVLGMLMLAGAFAKYALTGYVFHQDDDYGKSLYDLFKGR